MPKPSDLLQGTLDLLILKTIAREPLHGWGIAKRIETLSGDVLAVGQGSLYPLPAEEPSSACGSHLVRLRRESSGVW
jgi:Transcriptional regulator PadR-like family